MPTASTADARLEVTLCCSITILQLRATTALVSDVANIPFVADRDMAP